MHEPADRRPERRRNAGLAAARQRSCGDVKDPGAGDRGDNQRGKQKQRKVRAVQYDRAKQNATTCSSAVFIGEAGNSASASTAIAP